MSLVHICNTFFERELERDSKKDLLTGLRSHPIVLQLQFLPLVYAESNDRILVSDLPSNPDPRLELLEETKKRGKIEDWGFSKSIEEWASQKGIPYRTPSWEIVRKINSKVFSFQESPQLPGSALLTTQKEIEMWASKTAGPKVLKSAFGTAGGGHFHFDRNLERFLAGQNEPLIGEPWVERVFDFSTQWKEGKWLGPTAFENEPNGTYRATIAGKGCMGKFAWALEEHLKVAEPLVQKITKMGFFGHLGIDAYVYRWKGEEKVQPIVEINGRKTMSWVAWKLQQNTPDRNVRLEFGRNREGFLPQELIVNGKKTIFRRQISLLIF